MKKFLIFILILSFFFDFSCSKKKNEYNLYLVEDAFKICETVLSSSDGEYDKIFKIIAYWKDKPPNEIKYNNLTEDMKFGNFSTLSIINTNSVSRDYLSEIGEGSVPEELRDLARQSYALNELEIMTIQSIMDSRKDLLDGIYELKTRRDSLKMEFNKKRAKFEALINELKQQ